MPMDPSFHYFTPDNKHEAAVSLMNFNLGWRMIATIFYIGCLMNPNWHYGKLQIDGMGGHFQIEYSPLYARVDKHCVKNPSAEQMKEMLIGPFGKNKMYKTECKSLSKGFSFVGREHLCVCVSEAVA
jgi:hypothetical protein